MFARYRTELKELIWGEYMVKKGRKERKEESKQASCFSTTHFFFVLVAAEGFGVLGIF